MSTLAANQKFINGGYVGGRQRFGMHPQVRELASKFDAECRAQGYELRITSGHRSYEHQLELHNAWYNGGKKNGNGGRYASKPGHGIHELGLAMDVQVWIPDKGIYDEKSQVARKRLKYIADNIMPAFGMRWGGKFSQANEEGHFDWVFNLGINGIQGRSKKGQYISGFEEQKYIILDDTVITINKTKIPNWQTELDIESIEYEETEYQDKPLPPPKKISKVEKVNAVGIWQIIKLVADRWALSQTINDGTIAFDQGSLINFINKVVQEPWMEFFGDTIGDKYFFQARKERFDRGGFSFTYKPKHYYISEHQVVSDDLDWYDGPIYSWYQIIPQGSFLGEQNQIFAHVTAVFFEEYAEVWGSKPLSVVSNYLNFVKNADGPILYEKALLDLRYMVESNMYLPFTRQGTITVSGCLNWKRGTWMFYQPTREIFYIDGVNHRWSWTDNGMDCMTTLKVSRGMEYRYAVDPRDKNTKSYWNLILFDDPPPITKYKKEKTEFFTNRVYFDNDRSYLIDLNETWPPAADTKDKKMEEQIKAFPGLRQELHQRNLANIDEACRKIHDEYRDAPVYKCEGFIDSDFGNKNNVLPTKRGQTLKTAILKRYKELYPSDNIDEIEKKMVAGSVSDVRNTSNSDVAGYNEEQKAKLEDTSAKQYKLKANQRIANFYVPTYEKDVPYEEEQKGVNWKVNDPVFQYFLNRKQFNNCGPKNPTEIRKDIEEDDSDEPGTPKFR